MESSNEASLINQIFEVTNRFDPGKANEIKEQLVTLINRLINDDFPSLIQLLYRIDIDEKKLKQLLKERQDSDAASIIADLIIIRQLQKVETQKQFNDRKNPDEDDRW
ncbi:MAG: hypothetical protein M3Z92_01235 [Bacteroidota bacterium]|nr:hypothetical protein [Bacteroidota bacterium]